MRDVTIYSTPSCVHCAHAKEFFQDHGVKYTEHNVLSDMERRQEMIQRSGQVGVPVIIVGNDVIVGFNQPRIEELLGVR